MRCRILHESAGRMRVHVLQRRMTLRQADLLEYYLRNTDGITDVKVNDRTGDAIILYERDHTGKQRLSVIEALSAFDYKDPENAVLVPEQTGRALEREYNERLVMTVLRHYGQKLLLPAPVRHVLTAVRALPYVVRGIRTLLAGRIEVAALDAAAIGVSVLRKDYDTAGSVMFLLKIGEILEEKTRKKSQDDLARSMSLQVDKVWILAGEESSAEEVLVPVNSVQPGDIMVIRTGNLIPLDGLVLSGEATVNQASMTGESEAVRKAEGGIVFAGTVVEEGECRVRVTKGAGSGQYDRIIRMIEESEKLKSETEAKAFRLADSLVPYSFLGTAVTYLLTRNVTRALSFLMVDFSCALKLSMPLAVLSAIREAGNHRISVKGGKFLEAVSEAQTIVFDKTGTLTHACPTLKGIVTFEDHDEKEILRLAACLEEHYPHSVANAVVQAAKERELHHEEKHSRVEYVMAHGVASSIDGQRVCIGSFHFILEDENSIIPEGEENKFYSVPEEYTHLFMAISGRIAAVLLIEDPVKEEAPAVIQRLHELGFDKVVMMTGDSYKTAAAVARRLDLDEFYAEVLPADKAAFIRKEHENGRKVIMIGDGVNDTPALSEADAGIAINEGAAIAREVADITISTDDLHQLTVLKELSDALMDRIHTNYRRIIGFNMGLILLGAMGVLAPASSALLHNVSTLLIGMESMTPLQDKEKEKNGK